MVNILSRQPCLISENQVHSCFFFCNVMIFFKKIMRNPPFQKRAQWGNSPLSLPKTFWNFLDWLPLKCFVSVFLALHFTDISNIRSLFRFLRNFTQFNPCLYIDVDFFLSWRIKSGKVLSTWVQSSATMWHGSLQPCITLAAGDQIPSSEYAGTCHACVAVCAPFPSGSLRRYYR